MDDPIRGNPWNLHDHPTHRSASGWGHLTALPSWRDLTPGQLVQKLDALNEQEAKESWKLYVDDPYESPGKALWVTPEGPIEFPSVRSELSEITKIADKGLMVNLTHWARGWTAEPNRNPRKKLPVA